MTWKRKLVTFLYYHVLMIWRLNLWQNTRLNLRMKTESNIKNIFLAIFRLTHFWSEGNISHNQVIFYVLMAMFLQLQKWDIKTKDKNLDFFLYNTTQTDLILSKNSLAYYLFKNRLFVVVILPIQNDFHFENKESNFESFLVFLTHLLRCMLEAMQKSNLIKFNF